MVLLLTCDQIPGDGSPHLRGYVCLIPGKGYFWFKYNLGKKYHALQAWVQTHDLQIMTVHLMSLRCLF